MQILAQLNHEIVEFYDKLSSWEQSVVKDKGVSLAQIHTIEVLGHQGELRMKELAQRLGITTGTLTVQVDKLVQAQLVERRAHSSDRRSIVVALTETGRALYAEHDALHQALVQELTSGLSDEQIEQFSQCLAQINSRF